MTKKIIALGLSLILFFPLFAQKKSELAGQIHTLDSTVQAQAVQIKGLSNKIDELNSLCISQSKTIFAMQDSLTALRRQYLALIKQLNDKVDAMNARIDSIGSQTASSDNNSKLKAPVTQKDTILYVVEKFRTAYNDGNKDEWLKYALNPDKVSKMEFAVKECSGVSPRVESYKHGLETWFLVDDRYYVKQVGSEYKIDCEATFFYNKVSLKEFIVTQSATSTRLKVKVRLENNFDSYFPENTYYRFFCGDYTGTAYFFVLKNSDAGRKLFNLTKSQSDYISVIIEAKYMRGSDGYGNYDYEPVITKFIQEGPVE